ncbi:hypothetical protein ACP4OV_018977 [Aristida adscensionis]
MPRPLPLGFLGLDKDFGIWPDTNFCDGVIIGFVDSGIWPESPSFSDTGLGPLRPSWKGRCVYGERFNASMCNNKLVSARFFTAGMVKNAFAEFQSPRDKKRAPMVASSSSRGPNQFVREILKPEVIAPGANILATWPDESPLTLAAGDTRRSSFNIISGTSMACPHVAGVTALLRHEHLDWTPAMIRATPMVASAGHVRPQLALDPGLVYDAVEQDYVDFLCTLNYNATQIRPIVPDFAGCTRTLPGSATGLNYPSFVVAFDNGTGVRSLTQTATKVSEGPEAYTVSAVAPEQLVAVTMTPAKLEFGGKNEKRSYNVVFRSKMNTTAATHGAAAEMKPKTRQFGHIVWKNDVHQVRSPVVFMWS